MGSYGNIWDVIQGFECLLDKLESYKAIAEHFPDPEHFRININLGWQKLDKYYQLLSETPIYYAGLALHPAYRWKLLDRKWAGNPEWIRQAKGIVHDVWHYDYRETSLPRMAVNDAKPAPKRRKTYSNPFQKYLEETAAQHQQHKVTTASSHLKTSINTGFRTMRAVMPRFVHVSTLVTNGP
jgi:hypothetical protein